MRSMPTTQLMLGNDGDRQQGNENELEEPGKVAWVTGVHPRGDDPQHGDEDIHDVPEPPPHELLAASLALDMLATHIVSISDSSAAVDRAFWVGQDMTCPDPGAPLA